MLREVPFGTDVEGKRNGAFVAVTAWARIYENYDDPTMTAEYRASLFPLVLMVLRWDSTIGFVGGFVEEDASIAFQVRKEAIEEADINLPELAMKPIVSHEADRIVVHLFGHALNGGAEVPMRDLSEILARASRAEHATAEGNVFWAHLYGKGWDRLRSANNLAVAVGEELDAVRAWMYASAPSGACRTP